jgi:hypothetical protein
MSGPGTNYRWRWWTAAAFVLAVLVLAQACGQSSRGTGPTQTTSLQLKVRRAAEVPAGCTATYSVSGPGVNIVNAPLPANGNIAFQGQVGGTYTITVTLTCGDQTFTGTGTVTVQPGLNQETIEIVVTKAGPLVCSPNPVDPGQSSTCTCGIQSLPNATITWTGPVTPKSGKTTTFSSPTPGTYTVTCSVGTVSAQTSVTVNEPPPPPPPPVVVIQTGTIHVTNTGCCTFYAKIFVQPADTQVGGTLTVSSTPAIAQVPAGSYIVRVSCYPDPYFSESASSGPSPVTPGGTTVFSFNGSSLCG